VAGRAVPRALESATSRSAHRSGECGVSFQDVPEGKTAKNRLHMDVHGGPDGLDHLVARLESLGATRVREVDKGPAGHWWIMEDPEGNEFCAAG
jgi:hypothetical protein